MMRRKIVTIAVVALSAIGLGACADPYAYGRAPGWGGGWGGAGGWSGGWDNYYGDPYGWRHVPVGWAGSGFGWYGDYYYPGVGGYVYDRRGARRAWNVQQRHYWQQRVAARPPVVGSAIGGSIARRDWQGRQDWQGRNDRSGAVRGDRGGERGRDGIRPGMQRPEVQAGQRPSVTDGRAPRGDRASGWQGRRGDGQPSGWQGRQRDGQPSGWQGRQRDGQPSGWQGRQRDGQSSMQRQGWGGRQPGVAERGRTRGAPRE